MKRRQLQNRVPVAGVAARRLGTDRALATPEPWRRAWAASFSVVMVLAGCSGKDGLVQPPAAPPLPENVTVVDNVVQWSTDVESRGSVRYGFAPDDLDHMAYPLAAGRRDRALVTQHTVPLLDAHPGARLYLQTLNEAPGRPSGLSEVGSYVPAAPGPGALLTSTMIHIGFGDSHLITLPNGKRILIDGGERDAARAVAEYLDQHGVGTLDAVMATHVHIDHMGGLVGEFGTTADGILARSPLVFFDSPEKTWLRDAYAEALETASRAGVRRVVLFRGQTSASNPDLAWDPNVQVVVLSSGKRPGYTPSSENDDINNDSIVLKWTYGDVDFIIGGDAEADAEASILQNFPAADLEVEYYKAHHHGLPDASTPHWLVTLKPRVGFIPNTQLTWFPPGSLAGAIASTTQGLESQGAHVYVIDEAPSLERHRDSGSQYNVTFATDGKSYEVRLERALQSVPLQSKAACVRSDADLAGVTQHPNEERP